MPKKALSIILLLFLFPFNLPNAYSVTIFPGVPCHRQGSILNKSGNEFICIKKRNKLIWIHFKMPISGNKNPNYYIPPTPNSINPLTFSNIVERYQEIPKAVFDSIKETKLRNKNIPEANPSIQVVRSPGLVGTNYDNEEIWMKEVTAGLAKFNKFKKAYVFAYTFQDEVWAQKQMDSLLNDGNFHADRIYGGKSCDGQENVPMVAGVIAGWDQAIDKSKPLAYGTPVVLTGYCGQDAWEKWAMQSGTSHELSHQYQALNFWDSKQNKYDNFQTKMPCWGVERQAVLAGYSTVTSWPAFSSDFQYFPAPYYLDSGMNLKTLGSAPIIWSPEDVTSYLKESTFELPACRSTYKFAISFSIGTFTVMVLSAIAGYESTWALEPMLNDGIPFKVAFQNVYGISWDKALPIIAQAVSKLDLYIYDPPSTTVYQAKDPTNIVTLIGQEGCSAYTPDGKNVYTRIQVFQDGFWKDVPTLSISWNKDPSCDRVPGKDWIATIKVALDHGVQYRWLYVGAVNIGQRDEKGRGVSHPSTYQ